MTQVTEIERAFGNASTGVTAPAHTELTGHGVLAFHKMNAGQPHCAVLKSSETHKKGDSATPRIVEEWRRRMDMLRARQRLELQAQAICRRFVDGDKVEAAKLWAKVKKDPGHELRVWLNPFIMAMDPLDSAKADIEKTLTKLVKAHPVWKWAETVQGFGAVSLAGVIGECGRGPGEYRSVSALWKRMGMAVIEGGRQRRVAGDAALLHGYDAERRSHMWNIGGCLMKAQLRSEKDDGTKVAGTEYSLGDLGTVYLERKAYLQARDPERNKAHVHNDAKRYMEKRLLRQLWQEWRRANGTHTTLSGVCSPHN